MQSYHFGWYTIFVLLHKINLIEFLKHIDWFKGPFEFFKSFKIQSQLGLYLLLRSLLSPNWLLFVLGFHSFTFALIVSFICSHDHLIYTVTITRSSFYTPFCLYTVTSLNGYLTTSLPHSTALTLNMKILICCIGV